MGSFTALISGLCAFIPDKELGNPLMAPSKMMVILVDARPTGRNMGRAALDGRGLRFHYPVIRLNPEDLVGGDDLMMRVPLSVKKEVFYFLSQSDTERREIRFDPEEEAGAKNDFKVIQGGRGDFGHGVHAGHILEKTFHRINPKVFEEADSANLAAGRVFIDKGELSSHLLSEVVEWTIPDTLGGLFRKAPLSNIAALKFNNLKSMTLRARNISGGDPLVFKFRGDRDVEVLIGNLCSDSFEPKFFEGMKERDEDFRWFYFLFEKSDLFPDKLRGVSLPVPQPVSARAGSGLKPVECMRLNAAAQEFVEAQELNGKVKS